MGVPPISFLPREAAHTSRATATGGTPVPLRASASAISDPSVISEGNSPPAPVLQGRVSTTTLTTLLLSAPYPDFRTVMNRPTPSTLSLATRLTAVLSAALVLVLTILAVSPALHAWVHAEPADSAPHAHCSHGHAHPAHSDQLPVAPDHADDDAGCIVTLFAQGGSEIAVAPAILPAPRLAQIGDTLPPSVFCAPSAPAYLLPPGCGPPAA